MKTIAIIAEYNPFHNGHLFMLNKAMEITGADYSIALMSGNFVQRGIFSVCDKYTRAYMAVSSGIDLCLELPFAYASGSAYDFANGAIEILNKLNSIDYLCFGAENDNYDLFDIITDIIVNEPSEYSEKLKMYLKSGQSYPASRQKALIYYLNEINDYTLSVTAKDSVSDILSMPNNILALEYLAALKRTKSTIKPVIIKRELSMYNDDMLNDSISSALSIRKVVYDLYNENDNSKEIIVSKLVNTMPATALEIFSELIGKEFPLKENSLLPFIQAKLMDKKDKYNDICDMNLPLINKLYKTKLCLNYNDLISSLKSKDITESRISRALLHLILEYTNEDRTAFYNYGLAFYTNILSFRKSCTELIKEINNSSIIPLITKKSDYSKYLNEYPDINKTVADRMWELDINASKLYENLIFNGFGTNIPSDFTVNIPMV